MWRTTARAGFCRRSCGGSRADGAWHTEFSFRFLSTESMSSGRQRRPVQLGGKRQSVDGRNPIRGPRHVLRKEDIRMNAGRKPPGHVDLVPKNVNYWYGSVTRGREHAYSLEGGRTRAPRLRLLVPRGSPPGHGAGQRRIHHSPRSRPRPMLWHDRKMRHKTAGNSAVGGDTLSAYRLGGLAASIKDIGIDTASLGVSGAASWR